MTGIEVMNFTFFIVGEFSWNYTLFFTYQAVLGIGVTHAARFYIKRTNVFQWHSNYIWLFAFGVSLFISSILFILSYVPTVITTPESAKEIFQPIAIVGSIINWMRYAGVWVIIYFLYKILQHNSDIREEKLVLENLAKSTELELLKTQLNPHFLFNALNSIKALVTLDPLASKDAIVKLSELLRFTLNYGKEITIPLHDEVEEVKKYLALEKIRFGERLQIQYTISENTLGQLLPPALLLTLAENAIKHGITRQTGSCKIEIETKLVDHTFMLNVYNTGELNSGNANGIGLKHVEKRLASVFSEKATFTLTQINETVRATITIHSPIN